MKREFNLGHFIFSGGGRGGDSGFLKLIGSYSAVPRSRSPMLWLTDILFNALIYKANRTC